MKTRPCSLLVLIAGLLGSSISVFGQATPPPDRPAGLGRGGLNVNHPQMPTEVQELINQFAAQRDALLAERRATLEQLKTATREERRAIIETLRSEQHDRVTAQRDLARQIREEIRALRDARRNGGG